MYVCVCVCVGGGGVHIKYASQKRKILYSQNPLFGLAVLVSEIASLILYDDGACRRWHHASCESLNAAEFKFFNESDAPYTCNDCFEIEIANSQPFNYLYGLTRLRQINMVK